MTTATKYTLFRKSDSKRIMFTHDSSGTHMILLYEADANVTIPLVRNVLSFNEWFLANPIDIYDLTKEDARTIWMSAVAFGFEQV